MGWKKIIVSGSQAILDTLSVDNGLSAGSFSGGGAGITGVVHNSGEIASDISGSFNAVSASIATDIANISTDFADIANKPTLISSSAQVEATLLDNSVTFGTGNVTAAAFIGNGSQLSGITVDQAATLASTFTNQTSVEVVHNFSSPNINTTVYDADGYQIIPASVRANLNDRVTVTFATSTSGRIVVAKGGHIISGSVSYTNLVDIPILFSGSAQVDYDSIQNQPTTISSAQGTKLSNIAVTQAVNLDTMESNIATNNSKLTANTSNVTTAGALMDSEVTNLAAVKAINQSLVTSASPTFADLTISGDLIVQGDTTTISTANLLVEDKFILLNSGSTGTADGGIVIDEGSGNGHGYIYDSNTSRFGFHNSLSSTATSATPQAFASAVVDIDAGHSDISEYQKNGNVKVDTGNIFIYA
tara:strand:- start:1799 stop:3052 length:1254 start_codon:yes stop_codon:yes gene_type:complete